MVMFNVYGAVGIVPLCDAVVGGALDGLDCGFGDEADEVRDEGLGVGGGFVVGEEVNEAEVGVADAEEEDLGCVVRSFGDVSWGSDTGGNGRGGAMYSM